MWVCPCFSKSTEWRHSEIAQDDNAEAQFALGLFNENGSGGVTQNYVNAVRWYREAAIQGHPRAQSNFGAMYAEGRGVETDLVQAYAWFNLSTSLSDPINRMPGHEPWKNRDLVATKMTPDQIATAQALARKWAAKFKKE